MNTKTLFTSLFLAAGLLTCGTTSLLAQAGGPPPTVNVGQVKMVNEQNERQYIGKLASTHSVDLKARVSGFLRDVLVKEGDFVKKGDLVMQIEDTLYLAKVKSAEAKVQQKKTELEYATTNFKRQSELAGISAEKEMDEAKRLLNLRQAELAECEAALIEAKTNLSYTKIVSPIDGRIGKATYSPGNYLTPSNESLGSISKMSPIYVKTAISEPDYISMFGTPEAIMKHAKIRLRTADRKMFEETGYVKLVDNKIDPSTGTLMLWCVFENKSGRLIPGGIVDAIISRKEVKQYPAVLLSAILTAKNGHYVYVVDSANTVSRRDVTLGEVVGGMQLITGGLKEGETVVTDGTHKVMPGQKIVPVPSK